MPRPLLAPGRPEFAQVLLNKEKALNRKIRKAGKLSRRNALAKKRMKEDIDAAFGNKKLARAQANIAMGSRSPELKKYLTTKGRSTWKRDRRSQAIERQTARVLKARAASAGTKKAKKAGKAARARKKARVKKTAQKTKKAAKKTTAVKRVAKAKKKR